MPATSFWIIGRASPWIPLIVVLALYFVVQVLYLKPPTPSDQLNYFQYARDFPNVGVEHQAMRIGLLIPVRIAQTVFGYSAFAYYLIPFIAGGLCVGMTYLLGARLFSPSVGVAASTTLIFTPAFLNDSGHLLPDFLAAGLFMTSLRLILLYADRQNGAPDQSHAEQNGSSVRHRSLLVTVGLLLGWAYLVREFIVVAFLGVAFIGWMTGLRRREGLWIAGPAASVFVGETIFNTVVHGSPMARLDAAALDRRQGSTLERLNAYRKGSVSDELLRFPSSFLSSPTGRPVVALLVLALLTLLFAWKRREIRIVFAWLVAYWAPLTLFGGAIGTTTLLRVHKLRYWMPILPAVLIGGFAAIFLGARFVTDRLTRARSPEGGAGGSRAQRFGTVLTTVVVLASALLASSYGFSRIRHAKAFRVNGSTQMAEFRGWLRDHRDEVDTIWTDSRTVKVLPLFVRSRALGRQFWGGRVRPYEHNGVFVNRKTLEAQPGSVILIYGFGVRYLDGKYKGLPDEVREPAKGWRTVLERDDHSLVVHQRLTETRARRG